KGQLNPTDFKTLTRHLRWTSYPPVGESSIRIPTKNRITTILSQIWRNMRDRMKQQVFNTDTWFATDILRQSAKVNITFPPNVDKQIFGSAGRGRTTPERNDRLVLRMKCLMPVSFYT
uniref:WW domain-containing protein n=1 Tax=Mesocestoides corti TaxID=53468 RepID=A0A5K3FST3_MESCO